MTQEKSWIWDKYWHTDRVASCLDEGGTTNYQGAVLVGWQDFFADQKKGARILDLCTGNGAVPLIAAEVGQAQKKNFDIGAADLAAIEPTKYLKGRDDYLAGIQFASGVDVENLPFGDAEFDIVTSQYGIEYADHNNVLAEAARVLKAGGKLRFVTHASEGSVVANCRDDVAEASYILGSQLFRRAEKAVEVASAHGRPGMNPNRKARLMLDKADKAFMASIEAARKKLDGAANSLMRDNTLSVLIHTYRNFQHFKLWTMVNKIKDVRDEVSAHHGRVTALIGAAITRDEAEGWIKILYESGFKDGAVEPQLNSADNNLVGWVITAAR